MWKEGLIAIPKKDEKGKADYTACKYYIKVYDEPSMYGINEGKISKLMITINGKVVCNYDRGWDVKPTCEAAQLALEILLTEHN